MIELPKVGNVFKCYGCGMQIRVEISCGCPNARYVEFKCCNMDMVQTESLYREVNEAAKRGYAS